MAFREATSQLPCNKNHSCVVLTLRSAKSSKMESLEDNLTIMTVMSFEIIYTQMLARFIGAKSVMSVSQTVFYVATKQLIWQLGT